MLYLGWYCLIRFNLSKSDFVLLDVIINLKWCILLISFVVLVLWVFVKYDCNWFFSFLVLLIYIIWLLWFFIK